ncbi:hypothetical protein J2S03_003150 [Alicyclobacillus cycloheptanicus]|uniref:Transposase n=1 Tax=Alicyclobacillus cycloheptanicus TaxID=1457 RepID=A0ABT9XNK4_9BACL|nr:hypothetical protein [Alicyclobacillus cycloheptanicus]
MFVGQTKTDIRNCLCCTYSERNVNNTSVNILENCLKEGDIPIRELKGEVT